MAFNQDLLVSDLVRVIYRLDEAGAELIGQLTTRIRTRQVPQTGALTRKLGKGLGMRRRRFPIRERP